LQSNGIKIIRTDESIPAIYYKGAKEDDEKHSHSHKNLDADSTRGSGRFSDDFIIIFEYLFLPIFKHNLSIF
jgi:hypothetical protein